MSHELIDHVTKSTQKCPRFYYWSFLYPSARRIKTKRRARIEKYIWNGYTTDNSRLTSIYSDFSQGRSLISHHTQNNNKYKGSRPVSKSIIITLKLKEISIQNTDRPTAPGGVGYFEAIPFVFIPCMFKYYTFTFKYLYISNSLYIA